MEQTEVESQVIALLQRECVVLQGTPLAVETSLLASGLLDSFAVVTLIASLEAMFDIELDVETLDLDQLDTPGLIAALCLQTMSSDS